MHLRLATSGDRRQARVEEAARDGQFSQAAEMLVAMLEEKESDPFSYTTCLEIAELYESAGNFVAAEKYFKEGVQQGVRETYGACKQILLLQHAEFQERRGNRQKAFQLLVEAHLDSKRRKTYRSDEIENKMRSLALELKLTEEQLDKILKG